jgi:hypothetical protein
VSIRGKRGGEEDRKIGRKQDGRIGEGKKEDGGL